MEPILKFRLLDECSWHVKTDIYRAMGKTQEAQACDAKFDRMT
jgi:hypothetical protein